MLQIFTKQNLTTVFFLEISQQIEIQRITYTYSWAGLKIIYVEYYYSGILQNLYTDLTLKYTNWILNPFNTIEIIF